MQSEADTTALAATLLDWYREMGVDTAISDAPADWLERGGAAPGATFRLASQTVEQASEPSLPGEERPRLDDTPAGLTRGSSSSAGATQGVRIATPPRAEPRPGFASTPPDAAELAARTAAREATSLDALLAALQRFDGCGLKATAKNLCFYRGAEQARLMIIGEAPGRDEDLEGRPFVGRAGQLLDKMLASIDLGEADVHITNVVYWRPPGNRTPTPHEAQVCRPFLDRQMELVKPDVVLLLGGAAAKQMLDTTEGIMRLRGKWREMEIAGRPVRTMATLHPAYLLRTPAAKRHAWRDLLAVQDALATPAAMSN